MKKMLLIGAGEMTQLALKYLKSNNVHEITICNRKEEKGKKLAVDNNCKYSNLNNLSTSFMISTSSLHLHPAHFH